jgi:hypothetical protein
MAVAVSDPPSMKDVCYWHLAGMPADAPDIRYRFKNGHDAN